MNRLGLLLLICLPACWSGVFAITLVKDSRPTASIVISEAAFNAKSYTPTDGVRATDVVPARRVRFAADELQRYIKKISGARLPIVSENEPVNGPIVLVGESKKTEALKLKIPAGVTPARTEEGYLLYAKGDTLVLAGNDDGPYQGTFFAVCEFLNRQGVRWFMPGDFGECVPKLATITMSNIELYDKPDFIVRNWHGNLATELRDEEALWRLRNKQTLNFNEILQIPGDAWLRKYMPGKELVTTHPEYFARKVDGSIDPYMVNLSNLEVPKLVAEKIKAVIAETRTKDPNFNSLGFAPDDGLPMDLSNETLAANLGFADLTGREGVVTERSISEEWFRFMNKVAEEVNTEYPGFMITTNGYANRTFPPEGVKINPNVGVMFAAIWSDTLHAFDDPKSWQAMMQGQMLKRWGEICPHVFVYNYNEAMLVTGLTPVPLTHKLARNTPLFKKWGIVGFEDEQSYSWMSHGISTMYLRGKLYWHANDDVKAIVNDYFAKWYGPAAKPSQAYWEAIENALETTPILTHEDRVLPWVYTDTLIATLEMNEQKAEKAAVNEPFKTRVRVDRLILEHLKAYLAMTRAELAGDFAEAIRQADNMSKYRIDLNGINPFFVIPESKDPRRMYFTANTCYWNITQRKEQYQRCLDMTTGKTGDLLVKAPSGVKFTLDNADLGRIGRWYDPGFDRSQWKTISTAMPYYLQADSAYDKQGVPYAGFMWYVFTLDVPRSALGRPIHVYAPTVVSEAWVWTNGEYSGHRPFVQAYRRLDAAMDIDVTGQVKTGRNVIGIRVSTGLNRTDAAEGFYGPLFLYSPRGNATPQK